MIKIQFLRGLSISGALLAGFWLPIRLIGLTPSVYIEVLFDLAISTVSVINIYLHFFDTGKNPKTLKSWIHPGLILDIICFLPLSMFAFLVFDKTIGGILLLNLFTARHIMQIKPLLDSIPSLQPITYRLIPVFLMLPLLVHLVSCGWIALGSGTAGLDSDPILTYVKAIYWSFTTLTTVGYGDISAKTIPQMLYTCGVQVMGVGVFGFILSNVAGLLARSDAAREHHMDNLDKIETYMKIHKIPTELRSRIRTYYHYMWMNKKGYQDDTLLQGLPAKIQSELLLHINKTIIEKVPFLRGASKDLICDLMTELKPRICVPGEKIFKIDDPGDSLFIIQSGRVNIVSRENLLIANLNDGAFFGEIALISDKPRTATAEADSFCDLYELPRKSFDRVTAHYPEFRLHVETIMNQRKAA